MKLVIHVDGGSRGNPGPAAAGVAINSLDPRGPVHEAGYFLGRMTNNVAEYQGLIRALGIARKLQADDILIRSDSELLVRQVHGTYKVKSPALRPLRDKVVRELEGFGHWTLEHVRREQNRRADELVNLALDEGCDVIVLDAEGTREERRAKSEERGARSDGAAGPDTRTSDDGPRFEVCIESNPGSRCPAPSTAGEVFKVGPRTPAGMCIYAAEAVFEAISFDDPATARRATCARCGMEIRIEGE